MPRVTLLDRGRRKALRLLRPAFYRWVYGRALPGSRALAGLVRRWELTAGLGDVPLPPESWDEAYGTGRWDCLEDPGEALRSSLIAAVVGRSADRPTVLDVGCGAGLLRRELEPFGCRSYTGLDLSREAVERARRGAADDAGATFRVADAETFEAPEPFDAVVLNESLYYLRDPVAQARRYHAMVRDGGVLVISMFETPRTRAIARRLAPVLPPWRTVELEGGPGRWRIVVVRGGGRTA